MWTSPSNKAYLSFTRWRSTLLVYFLPWQSLSLHQIRLKGGNSELLIQNIQLQVSNNIGCIRSNYISNFTWASFPPQSSNGLNDLKQPLSSMKLEQSWISAVWEYIACHTVIRPLPFPCFLTGSLFSNGKVDLWAVGDMICRWTFF